MKCLQRNRKDRYGSCKRRSKIPLNTILGEPSMENKDQPMLSPSGLQMEIPKGSSNHGRRLQSSNDGYAKPKVERGKNGNNKRKRNEEDYNQYAGEERPAKMGRSDAVQGRANKIADRNVAQEGEKRPPTPPKIQKTTDDDQGGTKNVKEVPCTSSGRSVQAEFNLESFTFHKIIGQGAYGKVIMASHPATNKKLAVKVVQKNKLLREDPKNVLVEKQVLEKVGRSSFFTHTYGTFQTEDHLFYIMEYLRGELGNLIESKAPLPTDTIRFIAAEIICALQHLHSRGVIHRDLKPENILLDNFGHIKIGDFGISEVDVFGSKMLNDYVGTPYFMAPEITHGKPYNRMADYYSLGVILFEMATGQDASLSARKKSTYLCNINPDLRDVIEKLLLTCPYKRQEAVENLRGHPFFSPIDWKDLETGEATAPFHMSLGPEINTHKKIEVVKLIPAIKGKRRKISSALQKLFDGFSFISKKWRKMLYRP